MEPIEVTMHTQVTQLVYDRLEWNSRCVWPQAWAPALHLKRPFSTVCIGMCDPKITRQIHFFT